MGISTTVSRNDYTGNSSASTFAYAFRILDADDLLVTVNHTSASVETTLVKDVDFSVSGVGNSTGSIALINAGQAWLSSGNLATGYTMTIRRVRELLQPFDIRNQGAFYPATHEDAFDHMVMIDQQQQDELDRSIKVPETEAGQGLELPSVADRASKYLGFDSSGNPIATNSGISSSTIVSAFGATLVDDANASAALDTLGFSAFGKTIIDDASASACRNTLGASGGKWPGSTLADGAASGSVATRSVTTEKTTNYTITTADDLVRGNPDSASFTLTLPAASALSGKRIQVVHSGVAYANTLTIARAGSDTIGTNALTSYIMTRPGTKLTLVSDGTSSWLIEDVSLPQSSDNWIVNGNFEIWQAGTSFTSVSASKYAADYWAYLLAGSSAVVSLLRSTDVPTFTQSGFQSTYSLYVDNTTADASIAAGDLTAVLHPMLGLNFAHLYGKTVTLQFWVKSTKTGIFCVSFRNNGRDRSYVAEYTVNTTATWEKKSVTLTLNPSGGTNDFTGTAIGLWIGWTICGGSTFQTTANAWQTGNFHCTSNQVNGTDSTSNDFRISQVQLVVGNEGYSFRRFGKTTIDEVEACEVVYQKSYNIATDPATVSTVGAVSARCSSTQFRHPVYFRTRMINTPTVNAYSTTSGTVDKVRDLTAAADETATYGETGEGGFVTVATMGADTNPGEFQWVANAQITPA